MQQIQANFFKQVSKKTDNSKRLAEVIADLLQISKGEAYKKISGKSLLTLGQVNLLCNKFKIDFTVRGNEDHSHANINFTPFHTGKFSVQDYICSLEKFLINILTARDGKLSCATEDIPFFHLFQYPELTAFKLHFWQMRIIDKAPFKLSMHDWGDSILKPAYRIYELYKTIPSTEIWTRSSLLNTLDQIKYAAETKIISDRKLGRLICNQLRNALADTEVYAINKSKSENKDIPFEWYFYEIIGSITYLAEMNGEKEAFIRFNTFNTIKETNGKLSTEVKYWIENLIKDSIGFSGQGSVQRNKYLAEAYTLCDEMANMF